MLEAATRDVLLKKVFLKISQYSGKHLCLSLFLIKLQPPAASVMCMKLSVFHDTRISEAY